jgi:hypothetical protein
LWTSKELRHNQRSATAAQTFENQRFPHEPVRLETNHQNRRIICGRKQVMTTVIVLYLVGTVLWAMATIPYRCFKQWRWRKDPANKSSHLPAKYNLVSPLFIEFVSVIALLIIAIL